MVNNTIESNRSEAELASKAENAKRQVEADEFANVKENEGKVREWSTPAEKEALADKTTEIIGKHNEAGILMPDSIPKDQQPKVLSDLINPTKEQIVAKAEEIRNDEDVSPFDKMEGVSELIEKMNK